MTRVKTGALPKEATPDRTAHEASRGGDTPETNAALTRVLANLAEFCATTPSLETPIPTDETWTYWPCSDGEESRELWGNLTRQDRKCVEWNAQRGQFCGGYPL